MPRLPPAPQPAQAIACGSAFRSSGHEAHRRQLLSGTAACSAVTVLQLYPTLTCHTTRLLDGTHAIMRNADHAPCCMRRTRPTSDAQQASWQTMRRTRGAQGYSAAGRHPCNHFERGPCTVRDAVHTFNQRCAPSIVQTTRRMALRGTRRYSAAGRRACNEHSGSCSTRCVHAAWQLHPSAMRCCCTTVPDRSTPLALRCALRRAAVPHT